MTTADEKPICLFEIRPNSGSGVTVFHLENVSAIEQADSASLAEISTIVYGSTNNFVMDLGNTRKYELTIIRTNPRNYNNSSSDDRDWSNGHWFARFRSAIDFWQNFAYSAANPSSAEHSGGYYLSFTVPAQYAELYPSFAGNVYINGSVSPRFSGQKMMFTLPLILSSMVATSSVVSTATYTYRYDAAGTFTSVQYVYPTGSTAVIQACPDSWSEARTDGAVFKDWACSNGNSYSVGDSITVEEGASLTFTANWASPIAGVIIDSVHGIESFGEDLYPDLFTVNSTNKTVTVSGANDFALSVQMIAVGAGGAGGSQTHHTETTALEVLAEGGGGGAGQYSIGTFYIASEGANVTFQYNVGLGSDGSNGGSSTISVGGGTVLAANGGYKGSDPVSEYIESENLTIYARSRAAGGTEYVTGGESGYIDPDDSSINYAGLPGTAGWGSGTGGEGGNSVYIVAPELPPNRSFVGGGGGASSKLDLNITYGGTEYRRRSFGGNGTSFACSSGSIVDLVATPATSGYHGGGGGGGNGSGDITTAGNASGRKGADGLIAFLFFKR